MKNGISVQGVGTIPGPMAWLNIRKVGAVVAFAGLVALGSHIRVPIPGSPVPLTLQVFFVLLSGALLTPGAAAASMALFVLAGIVGAPVFASGGSGLLYLTGPTGGYLIGFVAGAAASSLILGGRKNSLLRLILAMTVAIAAIHLLGFAQLSVWLGGDPATAWRTGVLPFLPGDLLKIAAAAAFVAGGWNFFPREADRT